VKQRRLVSLSLFFVLGSVSAAAIARHPDFPPLAHTGGFGEPTCRECHQGEELNAPGARLRIEGVPQPWRPGRAYRITVTLRRDSLARAGFELAARFLPGGGNAGILIPYDSLLTVVDRDSISGISYAHHTRRGTSVAHAVARWNVLWTAPLSGSGAIAFNVAALAANDDNSNLGDAVYTASATAPSRRRR
jgi:hypothetical protein